MIRRVAAWAVVLVALLGSGCALLKPPPPPAEAETPAAEPVPLNVTVQAPKDLRELLEKYLDVVRLPELARGEKIDATELDRLVAAAPAQARALLETEGYFDAEVQAERDGEQLRLIVKPGARTHVSRTTLEVQGPLADAAEAGDARARTLLKDWRLDWRMPEFRPFRNADWSSAKTDALTRLRVAGYAAASFAGTAADVDADEQTVRLFVVADSGPLFRSGTLSITGLKYQDEQTVRNLMGLKPGTPLTETLLLDAQERLLSAGLYDAASVEFKPDPATAGDTPVSVRVAESPRQVWTFGVGIDADTGPQASVEHQHRRVFGWAATMRNKIEVGGLRQYWKGEISTHPLEKQYRWLVGGAVDRLEGDDDIVLSQSVRLGRTLTTPRLDRFTFVELERSSRRVTLPESTTPDGDATALSLNHQGVWRKVDDLLLPTRGYAVALQGTVGYAVGRPGGNGFFTRAYGRLTGYLPLPGGWFGQARVEAGEVFRPAGVPVPDSMQFRAGGVDSVRGYDYRSLGPEVDGAIGSGDVLFTSSVEVAHPIVASMPTLWGALFVDAGSAADTWRDLRPAIGTGAGIRWRSPVGTLRLDAAYGEEFRQWRLHFSIGITY